MAFLDNSGDIILDAVLTDLGRELLARGDGSFKITHFGLGDDEINYDLYNNNAATGAESTTIKQLPVFEALTESSIALKHRLISVVRNDLLYLPILKLNELVGNTSLSANGYFFICVDKDTEDLVLKPGPLDGGIYGANPDSGKGNLIRIDQGLDTADRSFTQPLEIDLKETQYKFEIDSRLGSIISIDARPIQISEINELNLAQYVASLTAGATLKDNNVVADINNTSDDQGMAIAGPRGTAARFKIKASDNLQYSTAYFTRLGGTMAASELRSGLTDTLYYIDAMLRVRGGNTGFSLDIPVRFVKKQ